MSPTPPTSSRGQNSEVGTLKHGNPWAPNIYDTATGIGAQEKRWGLWITCQLTEVALVQTFGRRVVNLHDVVEYRNGPACRR